MTAILFLSGLAADRRLYLGGLTLVERALLVARRAGVRRCLVAGATLSLPNDPRFPRITPVADAADARAVLRSEGTTRVLCLQASVVSNPASLARFSGGAEDAASPYSVGSGRHGPRKVIDKVINKLKCLG